MPFLTEQKLRLAIREEIEASKEYRNLSPKQKQLLEEGVVGKVVDAIKGAFKGLVNFLSGKKGDAKAVAASKVMLAEMEKFQQHRMAVFGKLMNYYNTHHKANDEAEHQGKIKQLMIDSIYNSPDEDKLTHFIETLRETT